MSARSSTTSGKLNESSIVVLLTTFFFPPLAICLLKGCSSEVVIGVCLTILGWIPGVVYATFLWFQAGGFRESCVAEARIERVRSKYRERRERIARKRAEREELTPIAEAEPANQDDTARSDEPATEVPVLDPVVAEEAEHKDTIDHVDNAPQAQAGASQTETGSTYVSQNDQVVEAAAKDTEILQTPILLVKKEEPVVADKKNQKSKASTVGGFYTGLFSAKTNKAREGGSVPIESTVAVTESELRRPLTKEGSAPGTPGLGPVINPTITK